MVPADAALKIVGLLTTRRRERRVAGADRMTIEEVVRQLLVDLASHPAPRPYAVIEEDLGWTRGVLASVLGGWGNTAKASFGGKRPYRIGRDDDGAWWMWIDAERAAVIADEEPSGNGPVSTPSAV